MFYEVSSLLPPCLRLLIQPAQLSTEPAFPAALLIFQPLLSIKPHVFPFCTADSAQKQCDVTAFIGTTAEKV